MNSKINIGVVSYAHLHAPRYTAVIAAHPMARLAGIAGEGVNAPVAEIEANRYKVPYYDRAEDLITQPDLQAIYIGTQPTRHLEVVRLATQNRLHILCDKPIATTLDQADEIIALANQANVKLLVPFNPRFQLPLIKVKETLVSGQAGELVAIYAVKYGRLPTKAPGPQTAEWFLDSAQAGGGGFIDIGIHAIDALRWLAGAEAKRVYARLGTLIHPDLLVDDLGTMTVEFSNGVVGVLSAGWANPDSYPTWLDVRFEILTTNQVFLVKSPYHDFTVFGQTQVERRYWWRRDINMLVDEFIHAILEDRQPAITGEDGRAALQIALCAYASASSGEVIEIHNTR